MKSKLSFLGILLSLGAMGWVLSKAMGQAGTTGGGYGTIIVKVPADATVTVGGQATKQTGMTRTFYTEDLVPGFKYQYEFVVVSPKGGKLSQWVEVTPGKTVTVDLSGPGVGPKDGVKKDADKKDDKKKDDAKKDVKKDEAKKDVKKDGDKKDAPKDVKKDDVKKAGPAARTFLFTYSGTVKDLKPGQEASVWLPVPQNTPVQDVEVVKETLPAPGKQGTERVYGNKFLFFQAKADEKGEVPFNVLYRVKRMEVVTGGKGTLSVKEDKDQIIRFLEPDKLVPISGKPLELIKDKKLPGDQVKAAKELYDVVNSHMKYDKPAGKPWGRGDSVWACDSKFGNCTDFHSLFISMARGNKIPSKFEMGFSIPLAKGKGDIGGYHCWAWFLPEGKGWVPVDISEANRFPDMKDYYFGNLTEDRVQFTTGRDINLVPQQKGPPLNYLIYPYVEVDGTPYPPEKVARKFAYEDVK